MNIQTITLDGENILKKGIYYSDIDWLKLSVGETSKNLEGLHGRVVSPTLVRNRVITLEGIIDRMDEADELEKISHLERIFALQGNTATLEEKEMIVVDQFGREWKIFVKIKTPLEFDEGDTNLKGSHWKWRVVLESTALPYYKSKNPILETGRNGRYGGVKFGTKLPITWNVSHHSIRVDAENISVPIKVRIVATSPLIAPLKIINSTMKKIFLADIGASVGDEIIIDSENLTLTKNGVNITDLRLRGSVWPEAKGISEFIVSDNTESTEKKMDANIIFSKILL